MHHRLRQAGMRMGWKAAMSNTRSFTWKRLAFQSARSMSNRA